MDKEKNEIFASNFNGDIVDSRWDVQSIGFSYAKSESQSDFYDLELTETLKLLTASLQGQMKLYEMFVRRTSETFNRVDKYYGIWKKLPKDCFKFSVTSTERVFSINSCELMVSFAEVDFREIKEALFLCMHRFCNAILFFSNDDMIQECMEDKQIFLKNRTIIDKLLIHDAIIVSATDFDIEGRVLYVYGKDTNREIKSLKSKLGL